MSVEYKRRYSLINLGMQKRVSTANFVMGMVVSLGALGGMMSMNFPIPFQKDAKLLSDKTFDDNVLKAEIQQQLKSQLDSNQVREQVNEAFERARSGEGQSVEFTVPVMINLEQASIKANQQLKDREISRERTASTLNLIFGILAAGGAGMAYYGSRKMREADQRMGELESQAASASPSP